MKKNLTIVIVAGSLLTATIFTGWALAEEGEGQKINGTIAIHNASEAEYHSLARISMADAIAKAQAKVEGKLLKVELENENGFLVYGLELVTADHTIFEVKVDAGSGDILLVEKDDLDKDREGQNK